MQEYADPVIDWLDAGRGILVQRLFRDVRPQGVQNQTADAYFGSPLVYPQSPIFSLVPDFALFIFSLALNYPTDHTPRIYPSWKRIFPGFVWWITRLSVTK